MRERNLICHFIVLETGNPVTIFKWENHIYNRGGTDDSVTMILTQPQSGKNLAHTSVYLVWSSSCFWVAIKVQSVMMAERKMTSGSQEGREHQQE